MSRRSKVMSPLAPREETRRGFLLIMVLLVVSVISLASLNFSQSMLIAHESAKLDSQRFQARQMVESAIQVARVYASLAPVLREEQGGAWDNAQKWQAINVVPHMDPAFRGNVTFMAPSLDQAGTINGFRYGLQNESAKLNLNALVQIDKLATSMSASSLAAGAAGSTGGGSGNTSNTNTQTTQQTPRLTGGAGGPAAGAFGSLGSAGSSLASAATSTTNLGAKMLLGIPGMTEDVADAILDFLDEDEEPRQYGCEYSDYYQSLQPAYRPINGPLTSIEQLLLVRGVTAQLLYGYDQNRNGVLDASEQQNMMMGVQPGAAPGMAAAPAATANASSSGMTSDGQTQLLPPSPLGWAPFLTLHSQERNVAADGTKRVNINMDDLQQLQADLEAAGVNELYVSYIIGYRIGGQPPPNASSPLQMLLTMMATSTDQDGVLGQQLSSMQQASAQLSGQGQNGQAQKQLWTSSALSSVDLTTAQGSVKFNQVLDLIDSSVTLGGQGGQQGGGSNNQGGSAQGGNNNQQQAGNAFASPINSSPLALADALPILMDKLTTVDSEALPGRINIMECPREILAGIPGMNDELVEKILEARVDGSQTENRKFETWLAVEGLVTVHQMRGFLPLVTCGGDIFKAQIVAYYEGAAPFCRAEAIISGVGANPKVLFFRRLDHLGRAFNVMTLGQRTDIGLTPNVIKR